MKAAKETTTCPVPMHEKQGTGKDSAGHKWLLLHLSRALDVQLCWALFLLLQCLHSLAPTRCCSSLVLYKVLVPPSHQLQVSMLGHCML